jgi:hypothetical protein
MRTFWLPTTLKHWLGSVIIASTMFTCSTGRLIDDNLPATGDWIWTDLGGPPAVKSAFVSNHEPLVVTGGQLLLGTGDGVWRRPLNLPRGWQRAGLAGFAVHAMVLTADGERVIAAGGDPDAIGDGPPVWHSVDQGVHWSAAIDWPRGTPDSAFEGNTFPFYTLEPDPIDASVIYGGLDAETVAVSVDGGVSWILTDGATEPGFGFPCVHHRSPMSLVLLQGCELPLDIAWVGARDVLPADRSTLPDFRMLFGGIAAPSEMGNRRINAIAALEARTDRVLVGVEGGLLALTTVSGDWLDRDDVNGHWLLRVDGTSGRFPYAYITAIAPLDAHGRRVLFGGGVNGFNEVLSLFETLDGGITVRRLEPPRDLHDPWVEQAWLTDAGDVLLVISQSTAADPGGPRGLRVFRLARR